MHPKHNLTLSKFLVVGTNTYNDQMLRPYSTHVDQHVIETFQEATHHGRQVNRSTLAGIAGQALRPSAEPTAALAIANGWDSRRFRFLMQFDTASAFGAQTRQIITGYTDHPGASHDGQHMDLNMRLYFNNSVQIQAHTGLGGIGNQETIRVADASQILFAPQYTNVAANTIMMRPADIAASLSSAGLGLGDETHDYRCSLSQHGIHKSKRANAVAPEYLHKTINALTDAYSHADTTADSAEIYAGAYASLREGMLVHDNFLAMISKCTQYAINGYMTYGEFCQLFPNSEHVRAIAMQGNAQQTSMIPSRGGSEFWHVATHEAVIASILSQAIPAIMMDNMITGCTILATNQTLNGQMQIQLRDPMSFAAGMDMSPYLQRMHQMLLQTVFADITRNNMFTVDIAVHCNILADTMTSVSLNGGPMIPYVTPSFCDAMLSPILSTDTMRLSAIAGDVEQLYSHTAGVNLMTKHQPVFDPYAPPAMPSAAGQVMQPEAQAAASGSHVGI